MMNIKPDYINKSRKNHPYIPVLFIFFIIYHLLQSVCWGQSYITIEEHIEAAQEYMANSQWDYAGYEWRNVLTRDAGNIHANLGLAEVLIKSGFYDDAVEHLKKARLSVKNRLLDIALAEACEKAGKFDDAAKLYTDVLKSDPYEYRSFRGLMRLVPKMPREQKKTSERFLSDIALEAKSLGVKALKSNEYGKATFYYKIASTFYNQPAIINDYGLALLLSGDNYEALNQFTKLENRMKNHCEIKVNTAMVVFSIGKSDQAQKMMENILGLCSEIPVKAQIYNNLGYIYEMGNNRNKARFAYEKALEINPVNTKAIMNLAYTYQRIKMFDKAITLYNNLLLEEPSNAQVWNRIGFIYEIKEDYKKAIASYKKAISLDPFLKDAYFNLATLYKKDDKQDEASEVLKKMNQAEFLALEKNQKPVVSGTTIYSSLLQYVDLFFANPVL